MYSGTPCVSVDELEEAMIAFHERFARLPESRRRDDGDALWYVSGIDSPVFNAVTRCHFAPGRVDRRIEALRAALAGAPHHWFLTPASRPDDLLARLQAQGASVLAELTGMAMPLADLAPVAAPEGITIVPADSPETVDAFAAFYPILFEAPDDRWTEAARAAERAVFADPRDRSHRFLALDGETVVGAAMVSPVEDLAVLDILCVLPERRNRGIGAALATAALGSLADSGARNAALWASPGARSLYQRLGFEAICAGQVVGF